MIDSLIEQLASQDAAQRRAAIIELGKAGDPRALAPLLKVYKGDPDPGLRELALKAGRHIKKLQSDAPQTAARAAPPPVPPTPAPPPQAPTRAAARPVPAAPLQPPARVQPESKRDILDEEPVFEDLPMTRSKRSTAITKVEPPIAVVVPAAGTSSEITPEPPAESIPTRKVATENDKRVARGKLDSAIGFRMQGNTEKALAELTAAVRADPEIAEQTIAMNLASELTGIKPPTEAIASIVQQAEAIPERRNVQNLVVASSGALTDPAMVGLVIDVLILTFITLLFMMVLFAGMSNLIDWAMTTQSSEAFSTTASMMYNPFRGATAIAMIIGLAVASVFFTASSLFRNGITYIVGTFMGGAGELFPFMSATTRFQSIVFIPITIVAAIVFFTPTIPALRNIAEPLATITGIILLLTVLGSFIGYIYVVARAHDVGFFKGALIVMAGSVAQSCVLYLCNMLTVQSTPIF